jgi:5'-3' exonuclease
LKETLSSDKRNKTVIKLVDEPDNSKLILWNSNSIETNGMSILNTNSFTHSKELYNLYYSLNTDSTKEWINGLEWILSYYQGHSHQNWTWFYPYQNTPHIDDLTVEMDSLNLNLTKFEKTDPFTDVQQLLMVLPKKSLQTFYKSSDYSLQKLAELADSEIFYNYFPSYLVLDGINKRFVWQCKPINLKEFNEEIVRLKIK